MEHNDVKFDVLLDDKYDKYSKYTTDSIRMYLNEIQRYPLLTADEEKELTIAVQNGNIQARNKLINSNLRLVVSIAKHYVNLGLSYLDLINEGNIGLMTAAEKFDPSLGNKFSTFATLWIKKSINLAVANYGREIRIPVPIYNKTIKEKKIIAEYEQEYGHTPSQEYIANKLDMTVDEYIKFNRRTREPISFNTILNDKKNDCDELIDIVSSDDSDIEDIECINPEEYAMKQSQLAEIRNIISTLSDKEQKVISLRYGFGSDEKKSFAEIGRMLGLTKERIRQIDEGAINKLRKVKTI